MAAFAFLCTGVGSAGHKQTMIVRVLSFLLASMPVPALAQMAAPIADTAPAQLSAVTELEAQQRWQRVRQAQSPSQQAYEVRGFLTVVGRGRTVDFRHLASGRLTTLEDPSVLQRPQDYEATVTINGRFYSFRPLSRVSLDAFITR